MGGHSGLLPTAAGGGALRSQRRDGCPDSFTDEYSFSSSRAPDSKTSGVGFANSIALQIAQIGAPDPIYEPYAGGLTAEERALIETHTIEGERLLARVGGMLGEVGQIVRSCHERWDGNGYPDRLANDSIPLIARIVMACDAFNAMTTDRSYREALTHTEAVAELRRNSGAQFDPSVVDALLTRAPAQVPRQALRNAEGSAVPLALTAARAQES